MYLKRIELQGFKSFARRNEFHFSSGITAVVGPNGSGKSNIADAIRWVLGEQSSRLLRTKKSEDVIFAGSSNRTPLGMAEVTLILDNSESWLAIEFNEVSITRRVYRSGDSEYLINGKRVRLKDVTDMLLRAGVAQSTYTVIGQGMVEAALSLRPEERRSLLEDASDVKRHQMKLAETNSRLESTIQNLIRIDDIVAEIEPRLSVLDKQSRQAGEYERVQKDLSESLVVWHAFSWYRINENLNKVLTVVEEKGTLVELTEKRLKDITEKLSNLRGQTRFEREKFSGLLGQRVDMIGQIERITQAVVSRKERIQNIEDQRLVSQKEIDSLNEAMELEEKNIVSTIARLQAVEEEIVKLAGELDQAEKEMTGSSPVLTNLRADLERAQEDSYMCVSKLTDFYGQLDVLRKRKSELNTETGSFDELIAKMEQEIEVLTRAKDDLEKEISALELEMEATISSTQTMRGKIETLEKEEASLEGKRVELLQERQRLATRLDLLSKLRNSNQGLFGGVKSILEKAGIASSSQVSSRHSELPGIVGIVANIVKVPKKLEVAIEVALGGRLQDIVVEKWSDAENAIEYLRRNNLGRATFLPLDTVRGSKTAGFAAEKGILGVASELVQYDPKFSKVVSQLLGNTVLVEDLPTARQLINRSVQVSQIVTLAGDVVRTSGAVTGGSNRVVNETGLLARERELRELPEKVTALDREITTVIDELSTIRNQRRELQTSIQQALKRESSLREEKDAKRTKLSGIGHSIERSGQQIIWQEKLRQNATTEQESLLEKERSLIFQIDALTVEDVNIREKVNRLRQELSSAESEIAASRELLSQLKMRLAVAERAKSSETAMLGSYQSSIRRLVQQMDERKTRLQRLEDDQARANSEIIDFGEELGQLTSQRGIIEETIKSCEEAVSALEGQELLLGEEERAERTRLLESERELSQGQVDLQRYQDEITNLMARMEADGLLGAVLEDSEEMRAHLANLPRQMGLQLSDGSTVQFPTVEMLAGSEITTESAKRKVDRLRSQVRAMGVVNPNAIAEYDETKQRYEFLKTQSEDLREAEKTLRNGITALEEIIKKQFSEAFELVSVEFSRYFSILFGGGKAELVLTRPEDPTQTGLDIIAQPPGKRLQSLSLLSGGERALTAAALLFALIQVNPTPFCVLDEVDAALDEANVTRISDAIKKLSDRTQFIIITHNRATIEASDTLYGITMGSDGVSRVISVKIDQDRKDERLGTPMVGGFVAGQT